MPISELMRNGRRPELVWATVYFRSCRTQNCVVSPVSWAEPVDLGAGAAEQVMRTQIAHPVEIDRLAEEDLAIGADVSSNDASVRILTSA